MKKLYFPIFCSLLLFAACESNEELTPAAVQPQDIHIGTVANIDCGLYIGLSQGQKVFDDVLPDNFQLVEGQKVELTFRPIPRTVNTAYGEHSEDCYEDDDNTNTTSSSSAPTMTTDPLTRCMNQQGVEKVQIITIKESRITT